MNEGKNSSHIIHFIVTNKEPLEAVLRGLKVRKLEVWCWSAKTWRLMFLKTWLCF